MDAQRITQQVHQRVGPSTVDEIRDIRRQLEQQAGGDIHRLAENARNAAEAYRQGRSTDTSDASELGRMPP